MSKKILVVDDEPLILTVIERALSREGYIIIKAQNALETTRALESAPFDMLITDLYIGDDSSEDIINRVKQTSPSVKILKMSGSADLGKSNNFIEKPFKIDELRQKVRDILNEPC